MTKRTVLTALAVLGCVAMSAQSMKMVVDRNGEVVGRYVRTNANTYTIGVQDDADIPKAGHRVVTFRAEAGQGILFRNEDKRGNINVRKSPSTKAAVVAKIPEFDGAPETFPCLGKFNGWYKTRVNGKVGYVRCDLMNWDGMDTF